MKKRSERAIDLFLRMRSPGKLPAQFTFIISLLLAGIVLIASVQSPAEASVAVSVTVGPPALPIYAQPLCPGPGFIWIPGYWAWAPAFGYYWVPGMWVPAPFAGALWTPGYWGWRDSVFIWHEGYWGPRVGFYGGINYGYGYPGFGYYGGYWNGGSYYYNRTVNNINVTNVTNVYSNTVSNVRPAGASFNGGPGGTTARPTSEERDAARQRQGSLTDEQKQQRQIAQADSNQRASVNHGRPVVAATAKAGEFTGPGVVSASRTGTQYRTSPGEKSPGAGMHRVDAATAEGHPRKKTARRGPAPHGNRRH